MTLELRSVRPEDAATLVEVYNAAFSIDAISLRVFPRTEESRQWWHDSIVDELSEPGAHFLCIYDSSSPSPDSPNAIVAFCKWNDPSAPIAQTLPEWPINSDDELANHFFGSLMRRHAEIMHGKKHWYLEILATRPEWQGKGAAGKLLRWGLERADRDETETYIEASPDGKPIYEHFGFKEVDRLTLELESRGDGVLGEKEFIECFMVRDVPEKI